MIKMFFSFLIIDKVDDLQIRNKQYNFHYLYL